MDANPSTTVLAQAQPVAQPKPSRLRRLRAQFDSVFLLTVFLPTLLAAVYYGIVASDVYISESRFVVRSPERQNQTGLGALFSSSAFSKAQDDTYAVHDFILSRDALNELNSKLQLRQAYASSRIDFVNRFPGLAPWDDSFEALFRHYLKQVTVEFDTTSSISVLRVRAFDAEQASRVNETLLEMGEVLVNKINTRSRQDLIQAAGREVKTAEERAKNAAASLAAYRSNRGVFDPDRQSAIQLQSLARLREELLAAESQLSQVRLVAPNNPQIAALESRVRGLRSAIADENAGVLAKQGGLSSKAPDYEKLALERTFADRQLGAALVALDSARNEAARKQLYLERLVQPNLPDRALEPRRLRSVAAVFLCGLMLWGVVSLVLASVREHTS